ncbi:MAG TPA: dihydrodipicolinate reductase C-terminal domain-containing protein [Terriglobales bacterium]|jgi:4-hydroxy-tetrahydrodipicolinate reductase|nr:dihydrodipicolinate reductase C-terminal domain-containing protein [Terriglobales bacterium]
MKLIILGRGKTGSLVADIAREKGHDVLALDVEENQNAAGLTPETTNGVAAVIDFTTPTAVLGNIEACIRLGVNMVVGTTGWYADLPRIRQLVEQSQMGFLYASNFSIGVNIFFEVARAVVPALDYGYTTRLLERHHVQKKDAPSGTAATIKGILQPHTQADIEITSLREGDVAGQHVIILDSEEDTMMLVHDAKSRRGFAAGAVRAAEWIAGKKGFFEFKDVLRG